ncbi:UNVERIFIED_CONTAM: Magnesium transporter MRS2-A, chloroplastic [Sesamum radiatum]|uniref:Magnesium transporter MRS2-A, chloroplastic n=1 Tax=Sesamum radiatum TaxID=300843 RepID=A0AAW2W5P0_SESRA
MEDSIAVNLSSRRLEVSRVELLLQVGTFCVGVGALIAGIFGMNLRSYLEENLIVIVQFNTFRKLQILALEDEHQISLVYLYIFSGSPWYLVHRRHEIIHRG